MKLRGKLKIITDIMCRNLLLPVLLFGMGLIAMYMIDTSMSNYYFQKELINQYKEPYKENTDDVFYVGEQVTEQVEEQKEAFSKFVKALPGINNIDYSGRFLETNGTVYFDNGEKYSELLNIIITESSLLHVSNLGIGDEKIKELQDYEGQYIPVMAGHDLQKDFPVGTIFSTNEAGKKYIIAGILPKDAKWTNYGKIGTYYGDNLQNLDRQLLVCQKNYEVDYYTMGDCELVYYVCDEIYHEEVLNEIYKEAARCGYAMSIYNVGEMIAEKEQKHGLGDNKQFISAVLLLILAIISMSVAVVATCMIRKNDFGVMYAFGISIGDIGAMIVMQNVFIVALAGIIAWFIRYGEINKMYFAEQHNKWAVEAWHLSHNIITPLIMAGCGLLIIVIASVIPIFMLRKEKPSEMIYKND